MLTLSIDTPYDVHREGDSSEQLEGTSPPLITVNLIPHRPLLGAVVDLTLNFVLRTSVSFEITDAGTFTMVMGECTYTPAKISLPLVNRSGPHISAARDT